MPEPYFRVQAALGGNTVELSEDPLRPGELLLTADAGTRVRVRLDEEKAARMATALLAWYGWREKPAQSHDTIRDETFDLADRLPVARDTVTEYRDGLVYSFAADPEV